MISNKLFGDKAFYKRVFFITFPIMIQNIITNLVSLLDNIMVGQVGTEQMTGVAVVNELLFVFNLCIFGAVSGAGIFTAQFYGKGDNKGVRDTFRIKMMTVVLITGIFMAALAFFKEPLISVFLHEGADDIDVLKTLAFGIDYIDVMIWGLPFFAIAQAYASTLRETGETVLPMYASVIAVFVNLLFNWLLIFGVKPFPELGIVGAAIATVLSRIVECLFIVIFTHTQHEKNVFIKDAFKSLSVKKKLVLDVMKKGIPLMLNETLWAAGMAVLMQSYSVRGIEAVSALNISMTVSNLFFCAFFAFGNAITIIVGQHLGSGDLARARDEDTKLIAACIIVCIIVGAIMILVAPLIPEIYNTTELVKSLAAKFLIISAILIPANGFAHASYFTLRSGGKTIITFLFDSVFTWFVAIPFSSILSRLTNIDIVTLYLLVQGLEIIKAIVGFFLVKSGVWVNNLVGKKDI